MKIIKFTSLAISDVKVICYRRFTDKRGFFTETVRESDLFPLLFDKSRKDLHFVQVNESYSKKGTIRGLHFQWNPYMGKLVRIVSGNMIDFALDIRIGSPTLGKIIAHHLTTSEKQTAGEWVWIPPGFAHGGYFLNDSIIEYLCTGEHNPSNEVGISFFSKSINWSLLDKEIYDLVPHSLSPSHLISDKDKKNISLEKWLKDTRSKNFMYGNV